MEIDKFKEPEFCKNENASDHELEIGLLQERDLVFLGENGAKYNSATCDSYGCNCISHEKQWFC